MRMSDWSSDVCSSDLLVLAGGGPAGQGLGMTMVRAQYFLQKNNICVGGANSLAQFMQNEAAVEDRKTLMRVYGKYFKNERFLDGHGGLRQRSEERRVGKDCVRTGRSRGWPYN